MDRADELRKQPEYSGKLFLSRSIASSKRRRNAGQGLAELAIGCAAIAPIALYIIDIGAFILAHTSNEYLARTAARAAASAVAKNGCGDAEVAKESAQRVIAGFPTSGIIVARSLEKFSWNPSKDGGVVQVTTSMTVSPPAPLPCISTQRISTKAVVPILSVPESSQ